MTRQRTNRRQVLKTGAALAAGIATPYLITSTALGDAQTPAASDRVTLGCIGVGNRGRALFRGFQLCKDAQIVAVSDCYANRRESMAQLCQGTPYADFRDIVTRDDIDAVVVATPDHWHVPIAISAAKSGKSVYVEKPLGLTIQQSLACQQVVAKSGVVFQYGTQQRSMAHCHRACDLVRRGAIGEVRSIQVTCPNGGAGGSVAEAPVPDGLDYDRWLGPAPLVPYANDRCKPNGSYWIYDYSIGYLAGWGAHPLDLMVWACDADLSGPIVVEGSGQVPKEGLYDTVLNWDMKLKLGQVDMEFAPGADLTKFVGDDGWIQVSRSAERTTASDPRLLAATKSTDPTELLVSNDHHRNFVDAVRKRDPQATVTGIRDAVRSDVISHLCDIAVRTGQRVTWDPIQQKIVDGSDQIRSMLERPMRAPWSLA